MDFELPEDLRMMKETLRRFIDAEVIPIEREAYDGHEMIPEIRARLEARARELGIWMIDVPEEYGGMGLGLLARVLVWEETGRTIAFPRRKPWIFGHDASPILLRFLRDDQKEKYLWPCLHGEKYAAFAQTEPDAGGDPASMKTTAVRDGGEYVINGMKRFVTGADRADFAQVICVTDREKGARGGISCILVDMDTDGVEVLRRQETMMDDLPCEVGFRDARVPAENLVGKEGDGFRMAQNWITFGRMRHGALGLGTMERCLELGASYAGQRVTFGEKLADRQAVRAQGELARTGVHLGDHLHLPGLRPGGGHRDQGVHVLAVEEHRARSALSRPAAGWGEHHHVGRVVHLQGEARPHVVAQQPVHRHEAQAVLEAGHPGQHVDVVHRDLAQGELRQHHRLHAGGSGQPPHVDGAVARQPQAIGGAGGQH